MIDFRDSGTWSNGNRQGSYTKTQSGITLTLNATPSPGTLWWDDKDGIGIRLSYEKDEIEDNEILEVAFHEATTLSTIYVADLFVEKGYIETGFYRINGGGWIGFDAASLPGTGTNGEHAIVFDQAIAGVNTVGFRAPGAAIKGEDHEFAVMGFDAEGPTAAIPEPTAAMLFGAGLLIASHASRRRVR
jgi:hypothetical protein